MKTPGTSNNYIILFANLSLSMHNVTARKNPIKLRIYRKL